MLNMDYKIKLRNLTDLDMPLIKKWLYLPHVKRWYHNTEEWLGELSERFDRYAFITHLMVVVNDETVGFCQFFPIEVKGQKWYGSIPMKNTYSIDYLIGNVNYLSKGLAPKIIQLLTKKILSETNAKRIIVQPEEENLKSRRALINAAYQFDIDNNLFIKYKKD